MSNSAGAATLAFAIAAIVLGLVIALGTFKAASAGNPRRPRHHGDRGDQRSRPPSAS